MGSPSRDATFAGIANAQVAVFLSTTCAVVMLVACGTSPAEPMDAPTMQGATATATLTSAGGTIELDNGTSLIVPQGALGTDTEITVTQGPASDFTSTGLTAVEFAPSGLVFAVPVELVVAYDPAFGADDAGLELYTTTTPDGGWRSSGEFVGLDPLATTIDASANTATTTITHFSSVHLQYHPPIYVGLDIPERYLEPGDIVYSLTHANGFTEAVDFPIHVGIFAGEGRVIESTLSAALCTEGITEGVGDNPFDGEMGFKTLCGEHIYLGARRPLGWTEELGEQAVAAARSYLGTSYGIFIFNESTLFGVQGMSCVELAEDSWEDVGINISPLSDLLLAPGDQYDRTGPVNRIEARAGDEVRVGLIAAVRDESNAYTTAGDQPGHPAITILVLPNPTNLDRELTVEPVPRITEFGERPPQPAAYLVYTPTESDIGQTLSWNARVDIPSTGAFWQSPTVLEIEVIQPGLCADRVEGGVTRWVGTWSGTCDESFSVENVALTLVPSGDHFNMTLDTSMLADGTDAPAHVGELYLEGMPWAIYTTAGSNSTYNLDAYTGYRPDGHLGGVTYFTCSAGLGRTMANTGQATIQIADDCTTATIRVIAEHEDLGWNLDGTFAGTEMAME